MRRTAIVMVAFASLLIFNTAMADGVLTGLIINGDFSSAASVEWDTGLDGYEHWRPGAYQTHLDLDGDGNTDKVADLPVANTRTTVKYSKGKALRDGAPEQFLEFKIVATGHDGSGITLRYMPFPDPSLYDPVYNPTPPWPGPTNWKNVDGLQLDLSTLDDNKYYYLEFDVYIVHHNLSDSGWYAGYEWPVQVRMMFVDANNGKRKFYWGFLDRADTQGLNPYTQIESKAWYHYRSPELRELWDTFGKTVEYPIDRIAGLSVQAAGWELKSRVANIDIVEYDSPMSISPGEGPNSTMP